MDFYFLKKLYEFYQTLVELKTIWMRRLQSVRNFGLYLEAFKELINARTVRAEVNCSKALNSKHQFSLLTAFEDAVYQLQKKAISLWTTSNQFKDRWSRRISEIVTATTSTEKIKARDSLPCPLLAYVNKISLEREILFTKRTREDEIRNHYNIMGYLQYVSTEYFGYVPKTLGSEEEREQCKILHREIETSKTNCDWAVRDLEDGFGQNNIWKKLGRQRRIGSKMAETTWIQDIYPEIVLG